MFGQQQCQNRISSKVRFRIWKMICSEAADVLPLSCQTRVYVLPSMGADAVVWGLLNWMHALSMFLLSQKVMDCSGSRHSLQEVRACCDSSGLVAGGLPVRCRATRCECTHTAGGCQLQQAESPVLPTRSFAI